MTDIYSRVARFEDIVLGHTTGAGGALPDRKLNWNEVALRAGVCKRTIKRRIDDGAHPPPDEIENGRWYWWLSTLEQHERERATGRQQRIGTTTATT